MCWRRVPDGGVLRKLFSNFNLIALFYFVVRARRGDHDITIHNSKALETVMDPTRSEMSPERQLLGN
jgi:hypothetical protein